MSQENAVTVAAWVISDDDADSDVIFSRGGTNTGSTFMIYWMGEYVGGSRWWVQLSDGETIISLITAVNTLDVDVWQHMAFTWDGSAQKSYEAGFGLVNDVESIGVSLTAGKPVLLGMHTWAGGAAKTCRISWRLDDFRLFDHALNGIEVSAVMASATAECSAPRRWFVVTLGGLDIFLRCCITVSSISGRSSLPAPLHCGLWPVIHEA